MGSKVYNAGGWGGTDAFWMQRSDQGQDFEIPIGHFITSPGDATVVGHASDGPFPNGFGSPYPIVQVHSGRFAVGNGEWYVGHCNEDVAPVGTKLKLGDPIARANNSLNAGRGWCELGKWDGGPHPMGEGDQWKGLFTPLIVKPPFKALRLGSRGIRVVKLTRRLHYIHAPGGAAYLDRSFTSYKTEVRKAVADYQQDHGLHVDGVVGEHTWDDIEKVFRKQRANRH